MTYAFVNHFLIPVLHKYYFTTGGHFTIRTKC